MTIKVDVESHRAWDEEAGLAISYQGTGIVQERQASFRFENDRRAVDFVAGYNSSEAQILKASKGLSPLEKLELLRQSKAINYSIDVDALDLRTAEDIDEFIAVFTACAATVGEGKQINVSIYGASLPKALWRVGK